jgi:hypothetical protein
VNQRILTNHPSRWCWLAAVLLLTACAPRAPVTRAPAQPPPVAAPAGARHFSLVPGESEVRILAYRDGPLAALGHNHVISTTAIDGTLAFAEPVTRSTVALEFPVDSLQVDIPAQRAEEGEDFPGTIDQSAIDSTRANMLSAKLLDAENYPVVRLSTRRISGRLPELRLLMDIVVRDRSTTVEVPVTVTMSDAEVVATGALTLRQTDLGLEPYSAVFGALFVRDALDLKFRLIARPAN